MSIEAWIELKLDIGVPSGKLKKPPKSCIPSRAKINMNRKSRNNSAMIEDMAFIRAITRFLREDQYLKWKEGHLYYRKVASSRLSWLVAYPSIFRLFMKGKFDAYVL